MRKFLRAFAIMWIAFIGTVNVSSPVLAQVTGPGGGAGCSTATGSSSSTVFATLDCKATDIFYELRQIILIVCTIAVIVTMATAISGRFPVGRALAIVGAVIIIGVASEVVTYLASGTTSTAAGNTVPELSDTGSSSP